MNQKDAKRGKRSSRQHGPRTYEERDLEKIPIDTKRWRYVLNRLLKLHNWRHSVKNKGVSNRTIAERARFVHWVFQWLRENEKKRYKLDPRSLSGRHIDFILADWQERAKAGRMSPATIQTYLSHLRTFTGWIGKTELMKPIECYFDDPELHTRSYIAKVDLSWKAKGVSAAEVIDKAIRIDRHTTAVLKLLDNFPLRFKEGCMFRPHQDVVKKAAEDGTVRYYLDTHRGTKGGRDRFIPIETTEQWEAIEFAKSVAMKPHHSVSDPRLNLEQALQRVRDVMRRRLGLTKRDLGVTPHGTRHQHAGELYEELTGEAPPVAGGGHVDKALDKHARLIIADRLGHGRAQITNAYVGKVGKADAGAATQSSPTSASRLCTSSGET